MSGSLAAGIMALFPNSRGLHCGFSIGAFHNLHTASFSPLTNLIPQGPWGHMAQFTGMLVLEPGNAADLFPALAPLKTGIFPCHPVF